MNRKPLAVLLGAVLAGWLLPACGAGGEQMSATTASTLQRDVNAVVDAADARRWDSAVDALDRLGADVASAQAAGQLSGDRAAQIRVIRQRVLDDLERIRASTPGPTQTPSRSPVTTRQTTPSPRQQESAGTSSRGTGEGGAKSKDSGKGGHDNGKGKRHGKDK